MEINKNNLSVIDTGDLCLHDLLISSLDFKPKTKSLFIKISDYNIEKFTINFENVFEFLFSSNRRFTETNNNELFGWEEIPNEYTRDYFLEETKNAFISNGGKWDDDLFAIRILFTNMSEIKIICETIIVV